MAKGILGTIGLALTLVFAIPVALLGLQFLALEGRPLVGVAFLAIAVLMVGIEEYLTTPTDLPGLVLGKTVDAVIENPTEEGETGEPGEPGEPEENERTG
jgi:hypothetical protein